MTCLASAKNWLPSLNGQENLTQWRVRLLLIAHVEACKNPSIKKKGYPKFKKARSVEYKTSGYKLSEDRQSITFIDDLKAGTFRLLGATDLNYYQLGQIKRVRVVRRADEYYAQFCIHSRRSKEIPPTEQVTALDVGLLHFIY